jgi:hypothetical protein
MSPFTVLTAMLTRSAKATILDVKISICSTQNFIKAARARTFTLNKGKPMDSVLELQVRVVYGTQRIYPMNDKARKLAELLQRKTLNESDLAKIKDLGFTIKWVPIAIA